MKRSHRATDNTHCDSSAPANAVIPIAFTFTLLYARMIQPREVFFYGAFYRLTRILRLRYERSYHEASRMGGDSCLPNALCSPDDMTGSHHR